ncbi:rCG57111 [Rattus norvegicus]|uniref:RCG57111 n=1 Tax=Rattus norvegicus TaxID=10116 RepID=A6JD72_RAT|nr:rCG57111 [Rattus norvegicus]
MAISALSLSGRYLRTSLSSTVFLLVHR